MSAFHPPGFSIPFVVVDDYIYKDAHDSYNDFVAIGTSMCKEKCKSLSIDYVGNIAMMCISQKWNTLTDEERLKGTKHRVMDWFPTYYSASGAKEKMVKGGNKKNLRKDDLIDRLNKTEAELRRVKLYMLSLGIDVDANQ